MTITVLTGRREGLSITVAQDINWGDLGSSPYGSWSNWPSWKVSTGLTVSVQIDDDNGSIDYRVPVINVNRLSDTMTVSLKISDTGTFTGEETTINFVADTPVTYVGGRYYRWTVTLTGATAPYFLGYATEYSTALKTQTLEDVDVFSSYTTSLTTDLGLVRNIQATALQGDPYVVDGYILTAAEQTYRPAAAFTNNNVTLTTSDNSVNKFTGLPVLNFDGSDGYPGRSLEFDDLSPFTALEGSTDWSIETYFRINNTSATQRIIGQDNPSSLVHWGLTFVHTTNTLLWYSGEDYDVQVSGITANVWHHVAVVRSGSNVYLYLNGTRVATDTYTAINIESPSIFIGQADTTDNGATDAFDFDGYMTGFRVSTTARYTGTTYTVPVGPLNNDANTTLLINDRLQDENGIDDGGVEYIVVQSGGSPVIKQKNPPQVEVVDYSGNPWDGTVDVVLRGLPKIVYDGFAVQPVNIEGII